MVALRESFSDDGRLFGGELIPESATYRALFLF